MKSGGSNGSSGDSVADVYLNEFCKNNKQAQVEVEDDQILINKPWGREGERLKVNIKDHDYMDCLNNLLLNPRFDAIIHGDTNTLECVYAFLDPGKEYNKDVIDREFEVIFCGETIKCRFAEPSERLYKLATGYETLPTDYSGENSIRQLIPFREYQSLAAKTGKSSERLTKYFDGKVPRCFFVELPKPVSEINLAELCRHINMLIRYYDRSAPYISIHELSLDEDDDAPERVRYVNGEFPKSLAIQPIDEILMRLVEVAAGSQPRSAYLYYYQIFEYAGYYFIDEEIKRKLITFLKDPALLSCLDEKVSEVFSMLTDWNHNDDVKMRKIIEEKCAPLEIWEEVEIDKDFFSQDHEFEGGFRAKALISPETVGSTWKASWMPNTYDKLTKIRNALVHARERRENKVILPTRTNNRLLARYIPLIRRMAEQIVLRT